MNYLSIPHYRGLKEKYSESLHGDGLYFTTDTHEIIANNASHGDNIASWDLHDGVLTLTMKSGAQQIVNFTEASETEKGLLSAADKKQLNNLQDNLDSKVDKVTGKGLSTNDYTTDEKNKLAGIAAGAQVNVIESVKVNGTAQAISNKEVNISVPTKLSQLTNDIYEIATSAEITAILN